MSWEPASASSIDPVQARSVGVQAGEFLISAVHAEVDGARIEPVQVLIDPRSPGLAVYAAAAVAGPLRSYLATAWGRAGHVSGKQIVAHPTIDEARTALSTLLHQRLTGQGSERVYQRLGVFQPEAGDGKESG